MDPSDRTFLPIPTPDLSPEPWSSYGEDVFQDEEPETVQPSLTLQTSYESSEATLPDHRKHAKAEASGAKRKGKNLTRREHKKSRAGCFGCKARKIKVCTPSICKQERRT